jgi:tRNA threonylcarbamoyladenosine biosynthesis protein TsaB
VLLLGIDTATRVGSVGLVRATFGDAALGFNPAPGQLAEACEVCAEVTRDTGLGHGTELLTLIDACLAGAGVALEDVGGVAVSVGPGSFTGLRVALATAKGLTLVGDLPLVGVPTLVALASTVLSGGGGADELALTVGSVVAPCLDARKGEVYGATFVVREPVWSDPSTRLERTSDDGAFAPAAFLDVIAERARRDEPVVLLGDGCTRYAAEIAVPLGRRARVLPLESRPPSGAVVARSGVAILAERGPDDRASLVPRYARASEAEIMRERRDAATVPR